MKQIIYILPLLLLFTFFSACEVEEGQSKYPRTLHAKLTFDAVESRFYQSVFFLNMMTKVDLYANALENEKEGIKNYFLPGYIISKTDNSWNLQNDFHEIIFTHNGKSVNETGAVWTMKIILKKTSADNNIVIDNTNFRVENLDDKEWKLTTKDINFYNIMGDYIHFSAIEANSELYIKGSKAFEKSPNLYDYKIEKGIGNLNPTMEKVDYAITEAVSYTYIESRFSELTPVSGKLNITIGKDKVDVTIKPAGVEITFGGLTEIYD